MESGIFIGKRQRTSLLLRLLALTVSLSTSSGCPDRPNATAIHTTSTAQHRQQHAQQHPQEQTTLTVEIKAAGNTIRNTMKCQHHTRSTESMRRVAEDPEMKRNAREGHENPDFQIGGSQNRFSKTGMACVCVSIKTATGVFPRLRELRILLHVLRKLSRWVGWRFDLGGFCWQG